MTTKEGYGLIEEKLNSIICEETKNFDFIGVDFTGMEYKGYHAAISYNQEDNMLVGEVLGIKDSLNFYGNTTKELKESFHQSIDNYLELCKGIGKSPQ